MKILLIEDEEPIRNMVIFSLQRANFQIIASTNIKDAWKKLESEAPDFILLDWMLPDENGQNFLKTVRKQPKFHNIPIIMLTARADEKSKLSAFSAGADDYITKPFSPKILIARIHAITKRTHAQIINQNESPNLTITQKSHTHTNTKKEYYLMNGRLYIDPDNHKITLDKHIIKLGRQEFKLLCHLAKRANKVVSREQLLENLWRNSTEINQRTIDVHIRRIRKIFFMFSETSFIESIRGIGYRLND